MIDGTDEQMATPSTSSSKLKPWKPRNSCTSRASSSLVRSAVVAMRQWSSRSRSAPEPSGGCSSSVPKRPMTVWVLPTSMASSTAGQARSPRSGPNLSSSSIVDDIEADVEDGGADGDGAGGDDVDAGGGVGADRLEGDAAARLEQRARRRVGSASSTARADLVDATGCRGGWRRRRRRWPPRPWSRSSASTWTVRAGHVLRARRDGLGDAEAGEVVVLEHHPVREVAAVVPAAAGPHRRLLERAQAGRRLAGVPDRGPRRGGVDEAAGEGGDAGEVAEEVQRGALGGEDRRQRAGDACRRACPARRRRRRRPPTRRSTAGVELGEGLGRARASRRGRRRLRGTKSAVAAMPGSRRAAVMSPSGVEVLGERHADGPADLRHRRVMDGGHGAASLLDLERRSGRRGGRRVVGELGAGVGAARLLAGVGGGARAAWATVWRLWTSCRSDAVAGRGPAGSVAGHGQATAPERSTPASLGHHRLQLGAVDRRGAASSRARLEGQRPAADDAGGHVLAEEHGAHGAGRPSGRRHRGRWRRRPAGAKTMPSSSEFDASRLAPMTPLQATSPAAQRPGSDVAPSRSATTPPQQ